MPYQPIHASVWEHDAIRAVHRVAAELHYAALRTDSGRCMACLAASAPGVDVGPLVGATHDILDMARALPDVPMHKIVCAVIHLIRNEAVVVPVEMARRFEPLRRAWRAGALS